MSVTSMIPIALGVKKRPLLNRGDKVLPNFVKCTESAMKALSISSHPSVKQNQIKFLENNKVVKRRQTKQRQG